MVTFNNTAPPRVVVVTGVSRFLGARVASRLAADPRIEQVIGLDPHVPPPGLAGLLEDVQLIRAAVQIGSGPCPVRSHMVSRGISYGLRGQEAPQAYGEEEAP